MTLGPVLEYGKMEMGAAKEMINRRNSWKTEYLKFKDSLLKKKEKVISDPSKWELPDISKFQKM